ncbi:MAG: hypothetical protein N2746_07900 [Deltaproteobacteria bacterium]|nr:hypothetical protein [Deltaproteobacteria bacterium]
MKYISIIRGRLIYNRLVFDGNIFISLMSGFFPKIMKKNLCMAKNCDCRLCNFSNKCAYAFIFEPVMSGEKSLVVPLPDVKIPFAFKWYFGAKGCDFILTTFSGCSTFVYEIMQTLIYIGEVGLGSERMKFKVDGFESLDERLNKVTNLKFDKSLSQSVNKIDIDSVKRVANDMPSFSMKLRFISDFDLVRGKGIVSLNNLFPTLYRRLRDRLKALYVVYLDEDLPQELKGLSEKAKDVINISKNDKVLQFKGKLSHFNLLFLLGSFFNVGRQCAFGKGAYILNEG